MSNDGQLAVVRRIVSDSDAPRIARVAAAEILRQLRSGQHRAEDLALVVSELVTNAVLHGADGHLELRVEGLPHLLRVEVRDAGTAPFEWPADTTEGHWGLNLVSIFGDRCGVIREPSTVVWCEFDLAETA